MQTSVTSASAWRALLWKDFHQVRPAVQTIFAGLVMIQVIGLAINLALGTAEQRPDLVLFLIMIACISPALVAVACCGMLIGHERQTDTWQWSSSLPIAWSQALFSKVVVSATGIFVVHFLLLILPLALAYFVRFQFESSWVTQSYASGATVLLWINALLIFGICTLLFRETLNALVLGMVALLVIQVSILTFTAVLYGHDPQSDPMAGVLIYSLMGCTTLVSGLVLVRFFRYRWTTGQFSGSTFFSSMFSGSRLSGGPGLAVSAAAVIRTGSQPNEFWMLLKHSARNSLLMRILILGAFASIAIFSDQHTSGLMILFVGVFASLLGFTVFEGDQTASRYRALADRGVSPLRLILARVIPAAVCLGIGCALLLLLAIIRNDQQLQPSSVWVLVLASICTFLIGTLCSLCFFKSVVSATVAFLTGCGGLMIYIAVSQYRVFAHDPNADWLVQYSSATMTVISPLILVVGIVRLVRRWLVELRPCFGWRFVGIAASAILVPVMLSLSLGFLGIRKVAWQGAPVEQLATRELFVPDLQDVELLPPALRLRADSYANHALRLNYGFFRTEIRAWLIAESAELQPKNDLLVSPDSPSDSIGFESDTELDSLELNSIELNRIRENLMRLDEILDRQAKFRETKTSWATRLNTTLLETALLVVAASELEQYELARMALVSNRRLVSLAEQHDPVMTVAARAKCTELFLGYLPVESFSHLGEPEELLDRLVPELPPTQVEYVDWVKQKATWDLAVLRGENISAPRFQKRRWAYPWLTTHFPPLRWREERAIAANLDDALGWIRDASGENPNERLRNILIPYENRSRLESKQEALRQKIEHHWSQSPSRTP